MKAALRERLQKGIRLFDLGRAEEAVAELEACRQQDRDDPQITLNLGHALAEAGKPQRAAALYREFYKNLNPAAWQAPAIQASPGLAAQLERDLTFTPGTVVDEVCREGVVKFVTRLKDDQRIESVLLPMETHATLCVSSQVGCRMGCRFCETPKYRFGLPGNAGEPNHAGCGY